MTTNANPAPSVRVLAILWPSFLMAGILEMLVFSMVDPSNLQWFGGAPVEWSSTAVYSAAFFMFWLIVSTASALTQLLATIPNEPDGNEAGRTLHSPR